MRRSVLAVRGGRTHLWHYGADTAAEHLVLLHGFRGDHHELEPLVAHLLGIYPGLRVTVPDLPGFGASPPLPGARHDVLGYAAWARALLRRLTPDGDAVLAGHSFGAVIAAATAATTSGRASSGERPGTPVVPRLVLVNPIPRRALNGRDVVPVGATALLYAMAAVLPEDAGTSLLRHPALTRAASLAMVRTPDRELRRWIHGEHDRHFAGFATRAPLLEAFRAWVTASVRDFADQIGTPTLLVGGTDDDLARVPDQEALAARFRDARLRLIPGAGHLTHYESPARVAGEIAEFLGSKDVPAVSERGD